MSSHGPVLVVVKVFTIITTVLMRFSLVPDFVRMGKQKSTGDMSVMPSVLLFTNCYALAFYSYVIDDIVPLFVTSVLGVVVGGVLAVLFYCWTSHKRAVVQVFVVASCVCLSITAYSVLALSGVTQQSHSSISTTLGFITIGTTIGLYASPMATIVRVIRTKTASSMPFTMGVVNVLNSVGWILYSSLVGNMFILAPNIGGIVLGSTQMVLTYYYSEKTHRNEGDESGSVEDLLRGSAGISVEVSSTSQEKSCLASGSFKGQSFVELHSPECRKSIV